MRFHPYVVFLRLCGASGLGVFLGSGVTGLINVVMGRTSALRPNWLLGVPILALLGALAGLVTAWITRRWFLPDVPYRRRGFTAASLLVLPLATTLPVSVGGVAVPIILAAATLTVTLWVRGYRRETALARAMMYGYGRPIIRR